MDEGIKSRFEGAGFEVLGAVSKTNPSVTEAFQRVVHGYAKPVQIIPRNSPEMAELVDGAWKAHARQAGVIAADDSFLAAGSLKHDWVHVRLTSSTNIFAMQDTEGDLLFVARSMTTGQVCAASREGAEYWILQEEFDSQNI